MAQGTNKNLDQILASFEHNIIEDTLKGTHGNQSRAAKQLGITKRKIQYKIRKYGIDCKAFKSHHQQGNTFFEWHPLSEAYAKGAHDDLQTALLP
jgi:Bacterial regulatory protein, Fis family